MNFITGIIDIVFPPRCLACGAFLRLHPPPSLCEKCMQGIGFISPPLCPRCGMPFEGGQGSEHLCDQCIAEEKPFAVARSMARYEGSLHDAIQKFKYRGKTGIGTALGNILADFVSGVWDMRAFDLVIPAPLHISRLRERGFNQAVILSQPISRRFRIPLDFSSLQRIRFTPPQVGMGRHERSFNVKGAFAVKNHLAVVGKRILLVDDVYTTGSTLTECSHVLADAGAAAVAVLTLARTIGGHAEEKLP